MPAQEKQDREVSECETLVNGLYDFLSTAIEREKYYLFVAHPLISRENVKTPTRLEILYVDYKGSNRCSVNPRCSL